MTQFPGLVTHGEWLGLYKAHPALQRCRRRAVRPLKELTCTPSRCGGTRKPATLSSPAFNSCEALTRKQRQEPCVDEQIANIACDLPHPLNAKPSLASLQGQRRQPLYRFSPAALRPLRAPVARHIRQYITAIERNPRNMEGAATSGDEFIYIRPEAPRSRPWPRRRLGPLLGMRARSSTLRNSSVGRANDEVSLCAAGTSPHQSFDECAEGSSSPPRTATKARPCRKSSRRPWLQVQGHGGYPQQRETIRRAR